MSKYNSRCPLDCNKKGCGIHLCQRYADYQQGRAAGAREFAEWVYKLDLQEYEYTGSDELIYLFEEYQNLRKQ